VLEDCLLEPGLSGARLGESVPFERQGYFCLDPDLTPESPVFNRTVALRDSWAKIQAKGWTRAQARGRSGGACKAHAAGPR